MAAWLRRYCLVARHDSTAVVSFVGVRIETTATPYCMLTIGRTRCQTSDVHSAIENWTEIVV